MSVFEYEDLQFAVGPTTSKVYFKDCEPPDGLALGAPGDVYLATIQKKLKLYGRVSDGWKAWGGPSKKDDRQLVGHPDAPGYVLWASIHRYGWFTKEVARGSNSSGLSSHDILQAAQKTRVRTAKKREKEDPSNPPPKRQRMTLVSDPSPLPSTSFCPPPPSTPSTFVPPPPSTPLPMSMSSTFVPPPLPSTPPPPPYSPSTSFSLPPSPDGPRLDLRDLHKTLSSSHKRRKSGIVPRSPLKAAFPPETPSQSQSHASKGKGKGKAVESASPVKLEPAEPASISTSSAGASASNVIDLTGLDDDDDIQHIPVPSQHIPVPSLKPRPNLDDDPLCQLDYPPSPTPSHDDHPPTPEAVVVCVEGPLTSEVPDLEYPKSPSPVYPTAPALEGLSESQRDAFMSIYDSITHDKIAYAYFKHEHFYMCKICVILHGQANGDLVIDPNDTFIRDNHVGDVHKQLLLHLLDHWDFRIRYETFTVQDLDYRLSCHLADYSPS